MSKQLLRTLYGLCVLSLCFFSCKKTISEESNPVTSSAAFAIPAATPVSGSVSGRIIDENNVPVPSATIECAGVNSVTDVDGFFSINNVTLDKYISTVKVIKAGYFNGYRSFCATAARNLVNIKLIPKSLSASISSTSAETVTLANSTQIIFQPNSMVIKSSGAAYSGSVNVYASYIDPTSADIAATVPGSFMGVDDKNLYALQSTGMIAVELESPTGEALQLAANMPASIKLIIPSSLTGNAPATIDTWSLDERGVWKKEGTASRSGNVYEMQVSHFSFWNCDVPMNSIYLSIHLDDQHANSLTNTHVGLTAIVNNIRAGSSSGMTDESGNVAGMVPAESILRMNIWNGNYQCSLNLPDIGPFDANAAVTVTATLDTTTALTISGIVNDCTGQPLQSGSVRINTGNFYVYAPISNGIYTAMLTSCAVISAVSINFYDNNSVSQVSGGSVPVNGNVLVVPPAIVCGNAFNSYDGIYSVESGWVTRYLSSGLPAGDALSGDLTGNPDVYLVTSGPASCGIPIPTNPGDLRYAAVSGASIAGIDGLEVTVDGNNNTTITSASLPGLANWAAHINNYDPATKTFHLSFTWFSTAGQFREYEIVLKYKQPRP